MPDKKVYANSRSIVHAGDGLKHVSAPPDVCKTPAPSGPTPAPYVNIAKSRTLKQGTRRVKIGGKSVGLENSKLSTSSGNEPGTAGGGLASSKTKGAMAWTGASPNVRFEGKSVVRFADSTMHNGNTYNTAFTTMGGTGVAYADDFEGTCPICTHGPDEHRVHAALETVNRCNQIIDSLDRQYHKLGGKKGKQRSYAFGKPYMIGVMICGVCEKAFAARSGLDKGTYFGTAVTDAGCERVPASASAEALASVNACANPRVPPHVAVDWAWGEVEDELKAKSPNYRNAPGSCAAQKLLAVPGHVPALLTETFYMPPSFKNPTPMVISYLRTELSDVDLARFVADPIGSPFRTEVLANRRAERVDHPFSYGDPVGSCRTCQDILFLTNCPTRACRG